MINELIQAKENGEKWNLKEFCNLINKYCSNVIKDDDMQYLLFYIMKNELLYDEILYLTIAMKESGEDLKIKKKRCEDIIIDKHSTGGVGDKVSLVLVPLLASFGFVVPKISGRNLGDAGGTLDKLECIPNLITEISIDVFQKNLDECGCSIISQSDSLVPADKKMYSLRNEIGAIESISLIASSIMSKKLAIDSDLILLEITYGNGAFMRNKEDAINLANIMIKIATNCSRKCKAVIVKLNEPLGNNVGNVLELIEAIEIMNGNGSKDIVELIIDLSYEILNVYFYEYNELQLKAKLHEKIKNGNALKKFYKMVSLQCGKIEYIKDTNKLLNDYKQYNIYSKSSGYIEYIDAKVIGSITNETVVNAKGEIRNVNVKLNKKTGDKIIKNELLCTLFSPIKEVNEIKNKIESAIAINPIINRTNKIKKYKMVIDNLDQINRAENEI